MWLALVAASLWGLGDSGRKNPGTVVLIVSLLQQPGEAAMRRNRHQSLVVLILVGAGLASVGSPSRLAAQAKLEFTPFAGLYIPTANVIDQSGVTLKQKTTVAFGGRVAVWVSERIGVEGSFGFAPSGVKAETPLGSADTSASIVMASGRVLIGLPSSGNTSYHLIVGGGIVSHGGAGYEGATGKTDIGGVVGAGARIKVGPSLRLRLDLEDNLFSAKFKEPISGLETDSKFQNDLVISLGLAIPLGGGR